MQIPVVMGTGRDPETGKYHAYMDYMGQRLLSEPYDTEEEALAERDRVAKFSVDYISQKGHKLFVSPIQ